MAKKMGFTLKVEDEKVESEIEGLSVTNADLDAVGTPLGLTEADVDFTLPMMLARLKSGVYVCTGPWGGAAGDTLHSAVTGCLKALQIALEERGKGAEEGSASTVVMPMAEGVN